MTVIGITLSMALVTAVIEGGYSGLIYMRNVVMETYGNYHGSVSNMSPNSLEYLTKTGETESVLVYKTLGWTYADSSNTAKPYLLIKETTPDITDFLNLKLISGRMPQNSSELLISEHLEYNGNVSYKVGDTVKVTLSDRYYDKAAETTNKTESFESILITGDDTAHIRNEYLVPKQGSTEKTYTVCGIIPRLPYTIEDFECPGYTAITVSDSLQVTDSDSFKVFFRLKDPQIFNDFAGSFKEMHPETTLTKNRELVALYGGATKSYSIYVYGLIILLIAFILFGTIALIYNAFSISVSERTKQIGILKSTGATKKQIRKTIFYEALFECGIGIPLGLLTGCLGIGSTLYLLKEGFTSFLANYGGYEGAESTTIKLVINFPLLLAAVLIVMATTFISAIIPALRAGNLSPVDSIRQNNEIKIGKKFRKSLILSKLFGIEGMLASKNYWRNRSKYRTTIISLTLSIVLFITASSFSSYLTGASNDEFYSGNMALVYFPYFDYEQIENRLPEKTEEILRSAEYVTNVIRIREMYYLNGVNIPGIDNEEDIPTVPSVVFMDDENFQKLAAEENIPYDPSSGKSQAIAYNLGVRNIYDEEGNKKTYEFKLFEEKDLPKDVSILWFSSPYEIDNKFIVFENVDKNGEIYDIYIEEEYFDLFYEMLDRDYAGVTESLENISNNKASGNDITSAILSDSLTEDEKDMLLNKSLFVKRSELERTTDITVIGVTYNRDYLFDPNPVIILPFSSMGAEYEEVLSDYEYYIYSSNAEASEKDINRLLNENNLDTSGVFNYAQTNENIHFMRKMINIFSFGFVLLISLVAIANVFNTISTNVALRRREFAMLKSMGMSNRGVRKMLNIECLIYGIKSILFGMPLAILTTYAVYRITNSAFSVAFSIPWYSVLIAIAAVILVVFITMLYASGKINRDNTIDALKNENV